jgi:3-hydroxyacyl-[acyl-carrier-protein] dehydratase
MRFLLVDRVLHLEPGVAIEAETTLPAGAELFRDHFPGFPVVPGVLLTEMIGQAAARCLHAGNPDRGQAMLGEIRHARFRRWVRPDEVIHLTARVTRQAERYAIVQGEADVGGERACTVELLLVFLADGAVPVVAVPPEVPA